MIIYGNYMIDADSGDNPYSPYYEGSEEPETVVCICCTEDFEQGYRTTNSGAHICNTCVEICEQEGDDWKNFKK